MVDFGEDLFMVDSYRIPWLIWLQMLVLFLLLFLLYAFGIFSPDLSDDNKSSSSAFFPAVAVSDPSTSGSSLSRRFPSGDLLPVNRGSRFLVNSSLVQSNQSIKGEMAASTTTRRMISGDQKKMTEEDESQLECSSKLGKDSTQNLQHPCNLFQMAGSAFLKCLGLDWTTAADDSRRPESRKQR